MRSEGSEGADLNNETRNVRLWLQWNRQVSGLIRVEGAELCPAFFRPLPAPAQPAVLHGMLQRPPEQVLPSSVSQA